MYTLLIGQEQELTYIYYYFYFFNVNDDMFYSFKYVKSVVHMS